jgi:hypothetical protein
LWERVSANVSVVVVGEMVGCVLPDEPEKAFGCGVLASLELVADEVLQGVGLEGSGELAFCDFLWRWVSTDCPV